MVTEAQKRATAKYRKEKMKRIELRFSPREMDLYEYVKAQDNTAGYIKELIRKDMGDSL